MGQSSSDERKNGSSDNEGFIRKLVTGRGISNPSTIMGPGDNAAVLDYGGNLTVTTSCLLTEGIHFSLVYNPLRHLGYKSAVIGFSNIYAMNAVPGQLLVSLALSAKIKPGMIEEFYEGIYHACENYSVDLSGGDVTSSLTGMVISCTAVGSGVRDGIIYRRGAEINDLICVTGDLGAAYIGLQVLERERVLFESQGSGQPVLEGYDYVIGRQLKPEARKDITAALKEKGILPTSMTDISDGLAPELMELCTESRRGCRLYPERIPVHPDTAEAAGEFNMEPAIAALYGGEDYELMFTVRPSDYEKIISLEDIKIIGHIVDETGGMLMVTGSGEVEMKAAWNSML